MGLLYDGALRGMHRDVIARCGRLLINKQHKGFLLAQNATSAARYQEDP